MDKRAIARSTVKLVNCHLDDLTTVDEKEYALQCLCFQTVKELIRLDSSYTKEDLLADLDIFFKDSTVTLKYKVH